MRFFACRVVPRTRQIGEFANQRVQGKMTHLFDEVTREIARMERSCNQHLGLKAEPSSGPLKTSIRHCGTYIYDVLLKVTIRTFLRARHLTIDKLAAPKIN